MSLAFFGAAGPAYREESRPRTSPIQPASITMTIGAAALTGRRNMAQLRHDLLGKEPHRFPHPGARNSAAPIELQDALIHRGELLLEALQALHARCGFIVDTNLLGLREVPGH